LDKGKKIEFVIGFKVYAKKVAIAGNFFDFEIIKAISNKGNS
jgi:hypothetical protein